MDRRSFLAGSAALAAVAGPARADIDDLRTAAREAWLYGLPLIELARLRAAMTGHAAAESALNSFVHARRPPEPRDRDLTAPECEVLYSNAWINLAGGSAALTLPAVGDRSFSLGLFDMYGNVLKVLGAGGEGHEGGEFAIMGPASRVGVAGYTVPEPRMPSLHRVIHAPGPWVWALARTHVTGDDDVDAARDFQDGLDLRVTKSSRKPTPPAPSAPRDAAWGDYFYAVQKLIEENPPPAYETSFFRRIAPLQLGMVDDFERARFADADIGQILAGVEDARILATSLRAQGGWEGGWLYPPAGLGDFGQDFLGRARASLTSLGALPPDKLFSVRAVGPDGGLVFPSAGHYRLTLPGAPPCAGFWTLTPYEVTPDGQLFLADNPAGRYALGAATPGLRRRPDGAIDVWIGRQDPGGLRTSNWLPTPARGPFALVLRAYMPRDDLLERRYRLPPLEPVVGAASPHDLPRTPFSR